MSRYYARYRKLGFSLIELVIAMSISTAIILALSNLYSNLYAAYLANINNIELQQNLRFGLNKIKIDLHNAGVFGSFSFHHENSSAYINGLNSTCTDDWCSFQSMGTGVKSYLANAAAMAPITGGLSTSDILRIQYGGSEVAYFSTSSKCATNHLAIIDFLTAQTTQAKSYILASANRAYLVNFAAVTPNTRFNLSSSCRIAIEATSNNIITVPDSASMTNVVLYTKYYFLKNTPNGHSGLYVSTYNGTSLSPPMLIADNITAFNIAYTIETTNTSSASFNSEPTNLPKFAICTSTAMNAPANTRCYQGWFNVMAITITLTGQSSQKMSDKTNYRLQNISDTVGWQ